MIVEVKEENLEQIVKFSWEIARDKTRCGFPRIESYEEMYDIFLKATKHKDNRQLLACYDQNQLIGVLRLLVEKDNKYLEALGGIYTNEDFKFVATSFICYLRDNYPKFELDLGFPKEYTAAIDYFVEINAQLMEACVTMNLMKKDFIRSSTVHEVIPLNTNNYQAYADFHDQYYPNIYWSSERVLKTIEKWKIYNVIEKQTIIGSIFIKLINNKQAEIFGLAVDRKYEKTNLELELLSESLYDIFQAGIDEVIFFVEEEATDDYEAALQTGFKQIDTYRSYKLILE